MLVGNGEYEPPAVRLDFPDPTSRSARPALIVRGRSMRVPYDAAYGGSRQEWA